jgi:hypothetical protein
MLFNLIFHDFRLKYEEKQNLKHLTQSETNLGAQNYDFLLVKNILLEK